jgi:hypothetical protein
MERSQDTVHSLAAQLLQCICSCCFLCKHTRACNSLSSQTAVKHLLQQSPPISLCNVIAQLQAFCNAGTLLLLWTLHLIVAMQTEKFYDMLGTGSFAALSLGSLLAARSMHARKVSGNSSMNSFYTGDRL